MRRTRVYVAGPLSIGDPVDNTKHAIDAGTALLERGYAPYVPHLTLFWHFATAQSYETWMGLDFEWLRTCDCVLRLPGESKGADREVADANAHGIPVFYSLDTLVAATPVRRIGPEEFCATEHTPRVLLEVAQERVRQDAKFGDQTHLADDTSEYYTIYANAWRKSCQERPSWFNILLEEVYEALSETDPEKLRAELVQVGAVAVAWIEAIDTRKK